MSVEIREATADDRERWHDYVERSPQTSMFHQLDVLRLLAEESGADLTMLVGAKGEEVVGIFPVFALGRGPVTGAFSPPPKLNASYLGPAMLNQEKLRRRKAERRRRSFVDRCLGWIDEELGPRYLKLVLSADHDDVRQFRWNDCRSTPLYTYCVDLDGDAEVLLDRFSGDARRNILDGRDGDHVIEEGGADDAARIIEQVRRRYEEQDRPYSITPEFGRRLYESLDDDQCRPYVCRIDGDFVGGILALVHGDTVYRWQGGVAPRDDVDFAVNDRLDWTVMRDAVERGQERYDLVGAGVPRVNRYKAKFDPSLRTFYQIESSSWPVQRLADLYRRLA